MHGTGPRYLRLGLEVERGILLVPLDLDRNVHPEPRAGNEDALLELLLADLALGATLRVLVSGIAATRSVAVDPGIVEGLAPSAITVFALWFALSRNRSFLHSAAFRTGWMTEPYS